MRKLAGLLIIMTCISMSAEIKIRAGKPGINDMENLDFKDGWSTGERYSDDDESFEWGLGSEYNFNKAKDSKENKGSNKPVREILRHHTNKVNSILFEKENLKKYN